MAIRLISVKLLDRREHSAEELRSKLKPQGSQRPDINPVLQQFEIANLLSSDRFVKQYSCARTVTGFRPLGFRHELHERGIDILQIEDSVNPSYGNWDSLLFQVYSKKYSGIQGCSEPERCKRVRYLLQRGYTKDQVDNFLSGLEDLNSH